MASKSGTAIIMIMIAATLASAYAVTGALTNSKTINNTGKMKAVNVEVYLDAACTQVVNQIDWGALEPGSFVEKTVYVKNTGNTVLTLRLSTSDWIPTGASAYITLTWNREGATVNPASVVTAVLRLTVSSSVSGISTFSFNIIIQGNG